MMRRTCAVLLAVLTAVALDWAPGIPPLPIETASAQLPINAVQGQTLQSAAGANANGSILDTSGSTAVTFQVSGTFSATVNFEGSNDGSTFNLLTCYTLDSSTSVSSDQRRMLTTGPKISSRAIRMSSVTSANTVGSTKNP